MAPEHAAVFVELRERAFSGGAQGVEFRTEYYGERREARFGISLHRNGWDNSFYAKTVPELLRLFQIHLDERGW